VGNKIPWRVATPQLALSKEAKGGEWSQARRVTDSAQRQEYSEPKKPSNEQNSMIMKDVEKLFFHRVQRSKRSDMKMMISKPFLQQLRNTARSQENYSRMIENQATKPFNAPCNRHILTQAVSEPVQKRRCPFTKSAGNAIEPPLFIIYVYTTL